MVHVVQTAYGAETSALYPTLAIYTVVEQSFN